MKTQKLIIESRCDLPMSEVLLMAGMVISLGRISNNGKDYTPLHPIQKGNDFYHVVSKKNKSSDTIIIYKSKNER